MTMETNYQYATFAGGCFWCMVPPFEALEGVIEIKAGYLGGHKDDPTYQEVTIGSTGHYEAIQITFNPQWVTYPELLNIFWRQIDPTDSGGQFADRGQQYQTAIFYHDEEQRILAEESKRQLQADNFFDGQLIVTQILKASAFYPAEEYHQDYHLKNPDHYQRYKMGSGRAAFIENNKGNFHMNSYEKPTLEVLEQQLTPMQYKVTQEDATEPPFDNEYWDHKADGLYVDIVSGEPLFSSLDKFDSGCGWPSFNKPIEDKHITSKEDTKFNRIRTEVRSKHGDSHLGHVFDDGPEPTGLRYCINSAAIKFIAVEDLEEEGYGDYLTLFDD